MATTQLAFLALMNVNPISGDVYQRGGSSKKVDGSNDQDLQNNQIKTVLIFDTEFRVIKDPDNSNTEDNPNLKTYLEREAVDGRIPVQVDQTLVITTGP